MKNTNQIRQGDLLLVKIAEPKWLDKALRLTPNRHGKIVLAQGESTLHEHTIDAADAEAFAFVETVLHVKSSAATLKTTHIHTGRPLPRHTPQELGGGYYRVVHQRELSMADLRRAVVVRD